MTVGTDLHVITETCCNDGSCVAVCPVNCIHPTPDEPGYADADMLYIDPDTCIDCGACVDVCPVNAIVADYDLTPEAEIFADINAEWYCAEGHRDYPTEPVRAVRTTSRWPADTPLRVAVVGSGPAGCNVVEELLDQAEIDVRISVFDRLPTPGGLVRYGVAPDHQQTKTIENRIALTLRRGEVSVYLNVEVGSAVCHDDLLATHHAVVYTVGAPGASTLSIPGEQLHGSYSAADFVGWYNGHPDHANMTFDLSSERALIVGNGNVAVDIARILTTDIDLLRRSDIAPYALEQLAESNVNEVVLIGRRGPLQSAFSIPALTGLMSHPDIELRVRPEDLKPETANVAAGADIPSSHMRQFKLELLRRIADKSTTTSHPTVELRFLTSPIEILSHGGRVVGVLTRRNEMFVDDGEVGFRPTDLTEAIDCGVIFRSVGYRGRPIAGVPFDDVRHVISNRGGRVVDPAADSLVVPGVYTAGWAKRGPTGVIGTNRVCARETVVALIEDYVGSRLAQPVHGAEYLRAVLAGTRVVDLGGWRAIDAHERGLGRARGAPREKISSVELMLEIAANHPVRSA